QITENADWTREWGSGESRSVVGKLQFANANQHSFHFPLNPNLSLAMGVPRRSLASEFALSIFVLLLAISQITLARAELSNLQKIQKKLGQYQHLYDCEQCVKRKDAIVNTTEGFGNNPNDKDIDIIVTYSDPSGAIRVSSVRARDLSPSWVWKDPLDEDEHQMKTSQKLKDSLQAIQQPGRHDEMSEHLTVKNHIEHGGNIGTTLSLTNPVKRLRKKMRWQRRQLRTTELLREDKEVNEQMELAAVERSESLDTTVKGKYSIWRRDYENPNSDSSVKLMRDQVIMAKVYASIARIKGETLLYDSLIKHARHNLHAIGEANLDAELQPSAFVQAKKMGHILSVAKDKLYDCVVLARKLRAMIQISEDNVNAERKQSAFLIQLAAKTVPRPLHCLPQLLTANYYFEGYQHKNIDNKEKLEDPSLFHYAIFSDNVLATSVVVNSTVLNANEPEKHVFHIVTDKLNFAAMRMWFFTNPPGNATIEVMNIDDFKWLNSSYCIVLHQLESARMKEYYFKVNNPSTLSAGTDNLKYRNPKYLSMLNHLRFYLPEVYPKLNKILFLDDDIVVQKDLTPLWSVDMKGMVNGAVETCKESFHRFDKYLNFSNPLISDNFDPGACGWAFGMNMFDLKQWQIRNITGIYHHWQELNEDRTLWKLGTLPPGLITFYNLTYPMHSTWHALGLGYDPALNQTEIENAAVVHYNGNYKPWLDLAIAKYKQYWSKYVMYDSPYSLSNGNWQEAFSHFIAISRNGFELTDPSLCPALMKAASNISFSHGACIHACSIKQGFEHLTSVGNSTMDFYLKWGFMGAAESVFEGIRRQDSVSWNTIVRGYLHNGDSEQGLWSFMQGRVERFEPNIATLVSLVQACRSLGLFWEGQELHGYMMKSGFWGVGSVQNVMLGLYCDSDRVCARKVFDEMHHRDVISWSMMIGGFVQRGESMLALELFLDMVTEESVEPDGLTLVTALKACSAVGNIGTGKSIHGFVVSRGFDNDVFVQNCLIDMYSKCDDTHSARRVFNDIPVKNNVSWNSILSGLVLNDMHSEAIELFKSMRMAGVEEDEVTLTSLLQTCKDTFEPHQCKLIHSRMFKRGFESNQLLVNSLMDAYAKCNLIHLSQTLFNRLNSKNKVSWGTMIAGFGHCGLPEEAMAVFHQMLQSGEPPNAVITLNLVEASGSTSELGRVKWAHGIATRRGLFSEVAVGTAIVEAYSKCGAIDNASRAFHLIDNKNIMSWSAMIGAFGMNGRAHESLSLYSKMKLQGLRPNRVTALSLLSSCSHGGLVTEGLSLFKEMVEEHGITPAAPHYACLVDLLSRAGRLEAAQELIGLMPEPNKLSGSLYAALLSGSKKSSNTRIGEGVAARLLELEPWSSGGYMLVSGVHAVGRSWEDVGRVRRLVRERRLKVVPGYSMVYVDGRGVKFVAGDKCSSLQAAQCSDTVLGLHSCIAIVHKLDLGLI
ncbi:hypothetical protein V2J09_015592, partial [Rumex salicifolius]